MAQVNNYITLDITKQNNFQAIIAKQGDYGSRFLSIVLVNDEEKINIEGGANVVMNAERCDGEVRSFLCTVNGESVITAEINGWMLELSGILKCSISVSDDGNRLTTTSFSIYIEKAEVTSETLTNEYGDVFSLLYEVINNENERENAEQARKTAENERENAEQARKTAENERENAVEDILSDFDEGISISSVSGYSMESEKASGFTKGGAIDKKFKQIDGLLSPATATKRGTIKGSDSVTIDADGTARGKKRYNHLIHLTTTDSKVTKLRCSITTTSNELITESNFPRITIMPGIITDGEYSHKNCSVYYDGQNIWVYYWETSKYFRPNEITIEDYLVGEL